MPTPPKVKKFNRPKLVIKRETAAALDRTKTSHRNAAYILTGFAKDNHLNCLDFSLYPSSIYRNIKVKREEEATSIRRQFSHQGPFTVHWDGKLLPTLTEERSVKKMERLPVLVTGTDIEKFLSIPAINSGSGADQANAVYTLLRIGN